MLTKEDIEHLSVLARVAISEEEKEYFAAQLDSVLTYVSEIGKVATEEVSPDELPPIVRAGDLRNVMRPDADPLSGGTYTEDILANAPDSESGYVKVQKII
jgi:aspartyl-tRNA(Asn)/glutamyl-tRNA(Gln) amidotransferase subunit C